MRRKNQDLSRERIEEVLKKGSSGVMAVIGDDDYPYAVPLSYVYADSKIYFHCAKEGHKIDAIVKNNKVSFCVVDQDVIVPDEYTTYYRSVIVFGKARILEREEKKAALMNLTLKYSPEDKRKKLDNIDRELEHVCMVAIDIEHMSGKEAKAIAQR